MYPYPPGTKMKIVGLDNTGPANVDRRANGREAVVLEAYAYTIGEAECAQPGYIVDIPSLSFRGRMPAKNLTLTRRPAMSKGKSRERPFSSRFTMLQHRRKKCIGVITQMNIDDTVEQLFQVIWEDGDNDIMWKPEDIMKNTIPFNAKGKKLMLNLMTSLWPEDPPAGAGEPEKET